MEIAFITVSLHAIDLVYTRQPRRHDGAIEGAHTGMRYALLNPILEEWLKKAGLKLLLGNRGT